MIKRKTKTKKRKNPELQEKAYWLLNLLKPVSWNYLAEGDSGEIYKFIIDQNTRIPFIKEDVILKPGSYVLKLLKDSDKLSTKGINFLKKLSKKKLIPEIYATGPYFIIMKYILGTTLLNLINDIHPGKLERIFHKLYNIVEEYHELGYAHGDLHLKNILIDNDDNVHLIDPKILSKDFEKDQELLSYYYVEYVGNS
jgi:serine/threonine protein kinase